MDPDQLLREINHLVEQLDKARDHYSTEEMAEMGRELAVKVDAMQGWLQRGGALPIAWRFTRGEKREPKGPRGVGHMKGDLIKGAASAAASIIESEGSIEPLSGGIGGHRYGGKRD